MRVSLSPRPAAAFGQYFPWHPARRARLTSDDVVFRAARDIAAGEQVLVDDEWDDTDYAVFV